MREGKDRPDGIAARGVHESPLDNEAQNQEEPQRASTSRLPIYRSRTAIALVLGFGLQSLNASVQFAFLPCISHGGTGEFVGGCWRLSDSLHD